MNDDLKIYFISTACQILLKHLYHKFYVTLTSRTFHAYIFPY